MNCVQGSVYSPEILDITPEDIAAKFAIGLGNLASLSLAMDYPTKASLPHSVVNGFKKLIAVCLETEYTIKQVSFAKTNQICYVHWEKIEFLSNVLFIFSNNNLSKVHFFTLAISKGVAIGY